MSTGHAKKSGAKVLGAATPHKPIKKDTFRYLSEEQIDHFLSVIKDAITPCSASSITAAFAHRKSERSSFGLEPFPIITVCAAKGYMANSTTILLTRSDSRMGLWNEPSASCE
jgi:hypothetical protein